MTSKLKPWQITRLTNMRPGQWPTEVAAQRQGLEVRFEIYSGQIDSRWAWVRRTRRDTWQRLSESDMTELGI